MLTDKKDSTRGSSVSLDEYLGIGKAGEKANAPRQSDGMDEVSVVSRRV